MTEYVSAENLWGLVADLMNSSRVCDDRSNGVAMDLSEYNWHLGMAQGFNEAVDELKELIAKAGEEID